MAACSMARIWAAVSSSVIGAPCPYAFPEQVRGAAEIGTLVHSSPSERPGQAAAWCSRSGKRAKSAYILSKMPNLLAIV
jgi:hypothetical protein